MNKRIKELRKALNLTQQEFADRLHVKNNTISNYEAGARSVSEAMIAAIIGEFNVNESWLRDGIGEMFREQTRDEELSAFFADVLADKPKDFRRRLVSVLAKLDVEHWHLLEEMAKTLSETEKADPEE